MISLVTVVTKEKGFANLQRNLVSIASDYQLGINILCFVTDETLYLPVKEFLQKNIERGEALTVYTTEASPLTLANEYLSGVDEYVFILNENIIMPFRTISRLLRNYNEFPNAGFIAGHFNEFPTIYWTNDLYGRDFKTIYWNDNLLKKNAINNLVKVDTTMTYGLLTKMSNFKESFQQTLLDGYNNLSYGIRLRRQGYQNYINTEIKYQYGGTKDDAEMLEKKV